MNIKRKGTEKWGWVRAERSEARNRLKKVSDDEQIAPGVADSFGWPRARAKQARWADRTRSETRDG